MKTLKYSRQRESIKKCLMARHDHPTADVVYASIREEFPNVSLGTVYRCGDGKDRFDAVVAPHYHFLCRKCGVVMDLPLKPMPETERYAEEAAGVKVDSHMIYMYGTCTECLGKAEPDH